MIDRKKVIKGLECCKIPFTECYNGGCPYFENDGCKARLKGDALTLLKAQESVEANCEYQCNKCKFYEGVHNVMGHAPCSLWKIGGVMWNDYCSHFDLWKEDEVE